MRKPPCQCGRAKKGVYTDEQCLICWTARNSRAHAKAWGVESLYWTKKERAKPMDVSKLPRRSCCGG